MRKWPVRARQWSGWLLAIGTIAAVLLGNFAPVLAGDRDGLPLTLEFMTAKTLEQREFAGTPIGGLSAIAYDRARNVFYAVSDDRSDFAPARVYTIEMAIEERTAGNPRIDRLAVVDVTTLRDRDGNPFPRNTVDLEGLVLSPQRTWWISSEGITRNRIPAFIAEFDPRTGKRLRDLPLPVRYLPNPPGQPPRGIRDNLGFEALAIAADAPSDPFRIFAATENALAQDGNEAPSAKSRLLHYTVGKDLAFVTAEHGYPLDPPPPNGGIGLVELVALDRGGHFLSLERTFDGNTFGAKIYQVTLGGANDTSAIPSLRGDLPDLRPLRKRLLLDLNGLGLRLDNLEGMTLGPMVRGDRSVVLVSDDNFLQSQVTQFVLLRLHGDR